MRTATEKIKIGSDTFTWSFTKIWTLVFFFSDNFGKCPRKALRSVQECQIKKQDLLNGPVGQKHWATHYVLSHKRSHAHHSSNIRKHVTIEKNRYFPRYVDVGFTHQILIIKNYWEKKKTLNTSTHNSGSLELNIN